MPCNFAPVAHTLTPIPTPTIDVFDAHFHPMEICLMAVAKRVQPEQHLDEVAPFSPDICTNKNHEQQQQLTGELAEGASDNAMNRKYGE